MKSLLRSMFFSDKTSQNDRLVVCKYLAQTRYDCRWVFIRAAARGYSWMRRDFFFVLRPHSHRNGRLMGRRALWGSQNGVHGYRLHIPLSVTLSSAQHKALQSYGFLRYTSTPRYTTIPQSASTTTEREQCSPSNEKMQHAFVSVFAELRLAGCAGLIATKHDNSLSHEKNYREHEISKAVRHTTLSATRE